MKQKRNKETTIPMVEPNKEKNQISSTNESVQNNALGKMKTKRGNQLVNSEK